MSGIRKNNKMAVSSERFEMFQDELDGFREQLEAALDSLAREATALSSLRKSLADPSSFPPQQQPQQRQQLLHEVERRSATAASIISRSRDDLDQVRKTLDEMEAEARQAPREYKGEMLSKVRRGRAEVSKLHSRLRKLAEEAEKKPSYADADLLGAAAPPEALTAEEAHRRQVRAGISTLERTSQSIARSTRVALESEAVGEEIVSDLSVQRETLERAQSRVHDTEQELGRSEAIMR